MQRPHAPGEPGESTDAQYAVTLQIAAEAAAWVARPHGAEHSSQMERGCVAWQGRSAAHGVAFERCTGTWQEVARVTLSDDAAAAARPVETEHRSWQSSRLLWPLGLALAGSVAVFLIVQYAWRAIDTYATDVSEQRTVVLKDGTRLSLNTSTRVRVELVLAQRTVSFDGGEALFEVELTPANEVGGTALAVTLIEGQASVRTALGAAGNAAAPLSILLEPGGSVAAQ